MKWNKKKLIDGIHTFNKVIANLPTVDIMELIYKLRSNGKKSCTGATAVLRTPFYFYVVIEDLHGPTKPSIDESLIIILVLEY